MNLLFTKIRVPFNLANQNKEKKLSISSEWDQFKVLHCLLKIFSFLDTLNHPKYFVSCFNSIENTVSYF